MHVHIGRRLYLVHRLVEGVEGTDDVRLEHDLVVAAEEPLLAQHMLETSGMSIVKLLLAFGLAFISGTRFQPGKQFPHKSTAMRGKWRRPGWEWFHQQYCGLCWAYVTGNRCVRRRRSFTAYAAQLTYTLSSYTPSQGHVHMSLARFRAGVARAESQAMPALLFNTASALMRLRHNDAAAAVWSQLATVGGAPPRWI